MELNAGRELRACDRSLKNLAIVHISSSIERIWDNPSVSLTGSHGLVLLGLPSIRVLDLVNVTVSDDIKFLEISSTIESLSIHEPRELPRSSPRHSATDAKEPQAFQLRGRHRRQGQSKSRSVARCFEHHTRIAPPSSFEPRDAGY